MHVLTINQLFIDDHNMICAKSTYATNVGLHMKLRSSMYNVQLLLNNSHFSNMNRRAMNVDGGHYSKIMKIYVTDCTFTLIEDYSVIKFYLWPVNISISFVNVEFYNSQRNLINIYIEYSASSSFKVKLFNSNNKLPVIINVRLIKLQISSTGNSGELIIIRNEVATVDRVTKSLV